MEASDRRDVLIRILRDYYNSGKMSSDMKNMINEYNNNRMGLQDIIRNLKVENKIGELFYEFFPRRKQDCKVEEIFEDPVPSQTLLRIKQVKDDPLILQDVNKPHFCDQSCDNEELGIFSILSEDIGLTCTYNRFFVTILLLVLLIILIILIAVSDSMRN